MRAAAQALPRPTRAPTQRHITIATVDLSIAKADALLVAKEARWKYQGSPPDTTQAAMEEADAAFRAANRDCRRSATADLAAFQESEARCLQEAYEDRHSRVVFNKINVLTGHNRAAPIPYIKSPTGDPTSDPQTIANVLATHSERTLNVESTVAQETLAGTEDPHSRGSSQERGRGAGPSAPALCTKSYLPALRRQRTDNRAGDEGYSKAEEHSTRQLCSHCADAEAGWPRSRLTATQGHISDMGNRPLPQSGKEATLTYIYKGKEDKLLPDNYRGISWLSVCCKGYTNVLIDRIKPTTEPTLHEAQCGFRASRGCADQLFTMRRICELSKAGRAPLFAAFVDYRKAFDSVNGEAMWTLMATRGVDPHLVSLVKEMYNGCSGEILVQGYRSRKFEMKTGMRQGCALSPLLFNLFMDHLVRSSFSLEDVQLGFPIASYMNGLLNTPANPRSHPQATTHCITFLLFGDDLVLLSYSKDGLTSLLKSLETTSETWGMSINYKKTKAMHFHPLSSSPSHLTPIPIALHGGSIDSVASFMYLGNLFTPDGDLQEEVKRRIARTREACASLVRLWKTKA
eukprot:gene6735-biopygen1929